KTYVAEVDGEVFPNVLKKLRNGVVHEDGPVEVSRVKLVEVGRGAAEGRSIVELVIHEGRNRIVRRLLAEVGHPVLRLTRTQFGPIRLRGLPEGELRELSKHELGTLLDAAKL